MPIPINDSCTRPLLASILATPTQRFSRSEFIQRLPIRILYSEMELVIASIARGDGSVEMASPVWGPVPMPSLRYGGRTWWVVGYQKRKWVGRPATLAKSARPYMPRILLVWRADTVLLSILWQPLWTLSSLRSSLNLSAIL